jgi:transposase
MDHIKGTDRDQLTLFPEALDDNISRENPVCFIDAYDNSLNLERLGFRHTVLQETGRPPYRPGDLLKLYLYGCLNRVRSSRQLEREAQRNVKVMWLMRRLMRDFPSQARQDHRRLSKKQPAAHSPGLPGIHPLLPSARSFQRRSSSH